MVATSTSSAAPVTFTSVGTRVVDRGWLVRGDSVVLAGRHGCPMPSSPRTWVAEDHAVIKEGIFEGFIA